MQKFERDHNEGSLTRGIFIFICSFVITGIIFYALYSSLRSMKLAPVVTPKTQEVNIVLPDTAPVIGETKIVPEEKVVEDITEPVAINITENALLAGYIISKIEGVSTEEKVILDLRSEEEYIVGHIRFSEYYDVNSFSPADFSTGVSYVLVCEEETMCREAKQLISKLPGFNVSVLEKGFIGWENEGYKVVEE